MFTHSEQSKYLYFLNLFVAFKKYKGQLLILKEINDKSFKPPPIWHCYRNAYNIRQSFVKYYTNNDDSIER